MKKLSILLVALFCFGAISESSSKAETLVIVENGHPIRYHRKKVFVIENHRPVRREVFVDEGGRYFRIVQGHREFIDRVYESYPDKYFYRDGRVREGVTISF